MSDIRFKISGSSQPFLAQIYNNNTIIQQMAVSNSISNSNVLNIFGNLSQNTGYCLKITDNIGNSIITGFTTPANIVTPTLVTKNILLKGTACFVTGAGFNVINDCLSITPALAIGECATLCFVANATPNTGCESVSIGCKPNGGSSYITKLNNVSSGAQPIAINICYGDSICYSLLSSCNYAGASSLTLSCATNVCGFNASAPTQMISTIVPTTLATKNILLNGTSCYNGSGMDILNDCLSVTPALAIGECTTLCFGGSIGCCTGCEIVALYCNNVAKINLNNSGSQSVSFAICSGDIVSYSLTSCCVYAGAAQLTLCCATNTHGFIANAPTQTKTTA